MPHKQTEDEARRAFTDGSSGATADMAVGGSCSPEERSVEAPHARKADPLEKGEKYDQLADKESHAEDRQEALIDEAVEETFPGSDPISPKHIT